jgi:hypothetical protein
MNEPSVHYASLKSTKWKIGVTNVDGNQIPYEYNHMRIICAAWGSFIKLLTRISFSAMHVLTVIMNT